MPFTLSHSAAVLPFINRKSFSATAVVAGSMAPDFEYFMRMHVNGVYSHTLAGLFYFDVPVAIAIAFIFHSTVKQTLLQNLPHAVSARFVDTENVDFSKTLRNRFWVIVMCSLLGAATHVFWDLFTHNNTYVSQNLPIYKVTFLPLFGVRWPLFFVLQQVSTVVGLLIVAIYVWRKPIQQSKLVPARNPWSYWLSVFLINALVVAIRFVIVPAELNPGNFIVTLVSGFCMGLIISGLYKSRKALLF